MQMQAFHICLEWHYPHPGSRPRPLLLFTGAASGSANPFVNPISPSSPPPNSRIINSSSVAARSPSSSQPLRVNSPNIDSTGADDTSDGVVDDDDNDTDGGQNDIPDLSGGKELPSVSSRDDDGIEIEIERIGSNSRRIRSRIAIEASLQTVWEILTDYEKLAEFIPGLAVSQLLEKRGNFVRLFQIGQQKLAFGLTFNAKGIVDCYERDLENLPSGHRRDIEFKMIEGDFQLFEGKWSIEQYSIGSCADGDSLVGQEFHTTLSYVVHVEPKLWLPVGLVEGRLCREIKVNLSCIRVEAQKADHDIPDH